jgi:hypothetical protein
MVCIIIALTSNIDTDGVARGSSGHANIGGIFKDHFSFMKSGFSSYIGIQASLFAEFVAAMKN